MEKFNEFMLQRKIAKGSDFTHLSMSNPKGAFHIQGGEQDEFYKLYSNVKQNSLSIVEMPRINTIFRFDIDLVFSNNYKSYDIEFVKSFVNIIRQTLINFSKSYENVKIFVLRRPKPYSNKSKTGKKDGLHILIPEIVETQDILNIFICKNLVNNLEIKKLLENINMLENPINVFDSSIYNKNGFMMYGSDKEQNNKNAYHLYCQSNNFDNFSTDFSDMNYKDRVKQLSIRNKFDTNFNINFDEEENIKMEKIKKEFQNNEREKLNNIRNKILDQKKKFSNNDINVEEVKDLLNCLDDKRSIEYDSWTKIGWTLYNINKDFLYLFDEFSKKYKDYDESSVYKFWENCKESDLTIGTLYYYANIDNKEECDRIKKKYKKIIKKIFPNLNEDDLANHFVKQYNDKFVYNDEILYFFNGIYWKEDKECIQLFEMLCGIYYDTLLTFAYELRDEEIIKNPNDKETIDEFYTKRITFLLKLKKNSFLEALVKVIKRKFYNNEIKFNTYPNLFAFNNAIFDLNQNDFIQPDPNHYISKTTGYDYEERNEELENEFDEIIKKIFPIEDVRTRALELFSTGLSGYRICKIIVQNGFGGNGKSLLNSFLRLMLGSYSKQGHRSIIDINTKAQRGANQEIAELNEVRFVIFQEPIENNLGTSGLNCSNLKDIVGSNQVNARQLYKTKSDVNMYLTLVIECNDKPRLSDTGDSMERRLEDIPYVSKFTTKEKELDEKNNIYFANTELEQNYYQEKFKISVFHYFADIYYNLFVKSNYSSQFVFTHSNIIEKRNKEYLKESNIVYEWYTSFTESTYTNKHGTLCCLVKTENEEVSYNQIYEQFTNSTQYDILEKQQKRQLSKARFLDKFLKLNEVRKIYKNRTPTKKYSGVLIGYQLQENQYDEDSDEA